MVIVSAYYRQIIYNAIRALDKNNEIIVELFLERDFIRYSDKIIHHREVVSN